ncbi:TetR/AcrR family transcriptional regulator [Reyranella sp. CPCC 100927]|uniref:TetR/AcrR family transcriptional regulator n=1 Tax=Reyranella sp. CPCC 100927 TaxID=2599616 RepID=UPI0011B51AF1|nr:TetR/AcrR family transcriptional regulator [Reyranella sp. CPCC 100927]TWT01710.1 TetR/AcrR family transcriptional regulator [Reyranella sp. CPCC 100927]
MDQKSAKGQATRAQIVGVATELFSTAGYEATSIETVLAKSGVSRGALYHHFENKEALFVAVFETMEARIAQATVDASRGIADRVEAMRVGTEAFLDLSREPAIRQIVLTDAPAVLGWQKWREIDARFGFGLLKGSLKAAAAAGRLQPDLVDVYAHILLAAMLEVALIIARADHPADAARRGRTALNDLIDKMLGSPSPRPARRKSQ